MGLGIGPSGTGMGGLDKLAGFGIARSLRIVSSKRNIAKAHCIVCGIEQAGDNAHEVLVAGEYTGHVTLRYVCRLCFQPIREANAMWNPQYRKMLEEWARSFDLPPAKRTPPTLDEALQRIEEYERRTAK